ncbi:MAG TPA: orotidine-5'-phosphate decarboxylase [Acidimicrobiales bacterium]|nr:orotidine-5'-phosphate decarboxylase [Acidimicrobiales bacterium]
MPESTARDHLALALDVPDAATAIQLARRLAPFFAVAKIGLELFVAEGPSVVRAALDEGLAVFLDLKLHDIPNTVAGAAERAAALGVSLLTVHGQGGPEMVAAAVEGFASGAAGSRALAEGPRLRSGILAVTVLTSDAVARPEDLVARTELAVRAGCAGIVCAAGDLGLLTEVPGAEDLVVTVPGIRLPGAPRNDQSRVATPGAAISAGADLLVVGRTVTAGPDPERAAASVHEEVASALAG